MGFPVFEAVASPEVPEGNELSAHGQVGGETPWLRRSRSDGALKLNSAGRT